jgi:hypothetical protein
MTFALETIVKGNMKRSGFVMNVDALALDDRMVELQGILTAINNTVNNFATDTKDTLGADVTEGARRLALTELLDRNEEIPEAIQSIQIVFSDSMFFKSPARVEELAKQQRRFNTLVNKINKHLGR